MALGGAGVSNFAYTSQSTVTGVSADGGVSGEGVALSRISPLALVWENDAVVWETESVLWEQAGEILDVYSGAAAAYSLRRLSSDALNVVRVRRSDNNAEQDFTTAQITDGTLVAFVGAGNDGLVTTWYDQSGNDNHATQATAGNQPKIVDSGALVLNNGKAAVDCGLQSEDRYLTRSYSSLSYQSFSAFAIGSTNGFSSVGSTILGFNISPRCYFPITRSTGLWVSYDDLEAIQISTNSTEPQFIVSGFANASTFEAFFNSQSKGSVASVPGSSSYISVGYNGGTAYHNGKIQEVIIYPSDQSANRVGIETNINDHYEIYP